MKNLKTLALALLLSSGPAAADALMVCVEACKNDCTKTMEMEMCCEKGAMNTCTLKTEDCDVTLVAEVCEDDCVKCSLECEGHECIDPMVAKINGDSVCFKCDETGDCVTVTVRTKCCDEEVKCCDMTVECCEETN